MTLPNEEPYIWKQYDPRWGDTVIGIDPWTDSSGVRHREETMAHAGCLITSMAILLKAQGAAMKNGGSITPGTLGRFLYDGGSTTYLTAGGGATYDKTFPHAIPGLSYVGTESTSNPAGTAKTYLDDKDHCYLLVALVKGASHFVAVYGVSGNDVLIADPGFDKYLLSEYSSFSYFIIYDLDKEKITPDPGYVAEQWKVLENINVRSAPGLNADKVGSYRKDTVLDLLDFQEADGFLWGQTADGWCALATLSGSEIYCRRIEEEQVYTITYHLKSGGSPPEPQSKPYGETIRITDFVPEKEGFLFLGWSEAEDAVSASYSPGSEYKGNRSLDLFDVWISKETIYGFGIDVSKHQGKIDWGTVSESGIRFVLINAGTTVGGKDPRFEENYAGATEYGLDVGAYFYTSSDTVQGIYNDIINFTDTIAGRAFSFPVFMDFENDKQAKLTKAELTELACYFLESMEKLGYYAGIYASESWYHDFLDPVALGGKNRLWMAKWPGVNELMQNESEKYAIHQYSETGHIPGISTTVDLDVCFVDFPNLLAEWLPQLGEITIPEDPTPPVDEPQYLFCTAGSTVELQIKLFGEDVSCFRNEKLLGESDKLATGDLLLVGTNAYNVVVNGDVSGDGVVNAVDYALVKAHVLGNTTLEGSYFKAALLGAEKITPLSYAKIKSFVLKKIETL